MIFEYTVIKSKRKTVAIEVDRSCNIIVRAPDRMNDNEIESFVISKKSWLEKTIIKQRSKGDVKNYTDAEIKALREKAKIVLPEKVKYYSKIMGVNPKSVKINSAKKRYGSCSADNSINFSLYLMDKDPRFIDYVVIHELAHIKHYNHSKAFYCFVQQFMPDYKEISKL